MIHGKKGIKPARQRKVKEPRQKWEPGQVTRKGSLGKKVVKKKIKKNE